MTGFPDSMWRSPARLIHPDHHRSHSHKHGRRDRHRGSERRHDPGRVTQQQDSAKRVKTATSSMSKAMEGDSAGRPSRSSDRSHTVSSSVSVVGRSRSDGGPMPSGTNGSERHRSRSGERGRRDRGHGSERCHESSRFHHSLGIESVGVGPAHIFVGRVQLQVQAGWCDGCPAFYFHSSSASSQSLSSSSRASVGRTSSKATEADCRPAFQVQWQEEDPFIRRLCGGKIQVRWRPNAFRDQRIWTPQITQWCLGQTRFTGRRDFTTHQGPVTRHSGSSLRSFPPWGRHRSRVRMFWVQSTRSFRTEWEPSDRRTGWLGHESCSPRDTVIPSPARKQRHLRRLRQGHQSSIIWGLLLSPRPR